MQLARMAGLLKASLQRTSRARSRGLKASQFSSRWLVIANCQTVGLANCLSLQCPTTQIDACNLWELKKHLRHWKARLKTYDHLIVAPEVESFGLPGLVGQPNVTVLPGVVFGGYHPDLCHIPKGKGCLKGPMDDYHSQIALAAFCSGLSPAQTARLYRKEIFSRLGYFDTWTAQREQLFHTFAKADLDIREEFLRWVRKGPFMYSVNHPHIEVLYGLARMVATRLPGEHRDGGLLPHDNLANSPVFPVYPDIAEQLGLTGGSTLFKPLGEYRLLSLLEFIEGCFSVYAGCDRDTLKPSESGFERALRVVSEEA